MQNGPVLKVVEGPLQGQEFLVTEAGLNIGREPSNEISVNDVGVSRQHASVLIHNGAVWVRDTGSRNGVFINGTRLQDARQIKNGDQLTVGRSIFKLVIGDTKPNATTPVAAPKGTPLWPIAVAVGLFLAFLLCTGLAVTSYFVVGNT